MSAFELSGRRRTLVVVGNGMVGHRLLEVLVDRGATAEWDIVTFCEEPRVAYDRVALSALFAGSTPEDLTMVRPGFFDRAGVSVHVDDAVVAIDRHHHEVVSCRGQRIGYDTLVLATGSVPFVPPVPGRDALGCFVYRTVDDLNAIRAYATASTGGVPAPRVGAVVGGGLLGLEAANALRSLGLETHVVEFAPRLMPAQIDDRGSAALRSRIDELGVQVHTGVATKEIIVSGSGRVSGMRFAASPAGGDAPGDLDVDLVVFSAGIR
ncbi:MAG: FAD-dependent oxidoreductase, partial [Actinomycetota bacterium]|nr:FAD-dependent oxidoreductase [Actinomycetota bacterium]